MINMTENMNEQFKNLVELQTRSFEPMRQFATVATEAAEQLVRKNYAVTGDFIDFATKQVNLPLQSQNLSEVAGAQMAEATAFGELMNGRASEYADMAQEFTGKVKEATENVAASLKQ